MVDGGRLLEKGWSVAEHAILTGFREIADILRYGPRIASLKEAGREIRAIKQNPAIINVTSSHENPKIAALGQAIEEMLREPLVQRFKRNKLHFVITPALSDLKKHPYPWEILSHINAISEHGVESFKLKIIKIPRDFFEELSLSELKNIVGHEIGHHLLADNHARRGVVDIFRRKPHDIEKFSDQVGAFLSGESDGLKTGLRKSANLTLRKIDNLPDDNWLARYIKRKAAELDVNKVRRSHPGFIERDNNIDDMAKRLTQNGRSHVEAELARKLETEHRKLFPHHFDRPIDNPSR